MGKLKIAGLTILVLLIPLFIGFYELGLFKILEPKRENIKREIFENTKSYLHGVQQDLGKYYHEYQGADASGKSAIRATIRMRFAEVDADKLQNQQLANFLTKMRGY